MDVTDGQDTRVSGAAAPGWFRVPDGRLLYWDGTAWHTEDAAGLTAPPERPQPQLPTRRRITWAFVAGVLGGLIMGILYAASGAEPIAVYLPRMAVMALAGAATGCALEYLRVAGPRWVSWSLLGLLTAGWLIYGWRQWSIAPEAYQAGAGLRAVWWSFAGAFIASSIVAGYGKVRANRSSPPVARSLPSGGAQ